MNVEAGATGADSFRSRVNDLLHTSILEAAWIRACDTAWEDIRLVDIAADVGVSRQTIYNEFGSKDQLARALFEREMNRFLEGMEKILASEEHLSGAIRTTVVWMLDEAAKHPMLKRLLRDARAGNGQTLLPLLTVRAEVILEPVRATLVDLAAQKWPRVERDAAMVAVDMMIRFTLSQIILPTDLKVEGMVEGLVVMAAHLESREGP